MKAIVALVLVAVLSACATANKINAVSLGMTKAQVIEAMGEPVSISATEGVEYMTYRLSETSDDAFYGVTTPYFVRLVGGTVDAYGRSGDFGTNLPPTVRILTE